MKKIFLTEKQLYNNFVLKEYQGEQLVLPFDGDYSIWNRHAYNDMQFVDYLERNSVGKQLETKYKNYTEFINSLSSNDLLNLADSLFFYGAYGDCYSYDKLNYFAYKLSEIYRQKTNIPLFNEKYIDVESAKNFRSDWDLEIHDDTSNLDKKGVKNIYDLISISNNPKDAADGFIKFAQHQLIKFFNSFFTINDNGLIYCERNITTPDFEDKWMVYGTDEYSDENFKEFYTELNKMYHGHIGIYWSYMQDTASVYENDIYSDDSYKNEIKLKGYTRIEDIDWENTFKQFECGERELRIKENGLIQIEELRLIRNNKLVSANYPFVVKA